MKMMEWFKCSKKLPKDDGDYLTYIMDNGCSYRVEVQRFYNKERVLRGIYSDTYTHWGNELWDDYIVTHWMPLPNPPEE